MSMLASGELNEWILLSGRAVILIAAFAAFAIAFGRWRRENRRAQQQLLQQLDDTRVETRSIADLARELSAQLAALDQRMEVRQHLAAARVGNAQRGYDLALQMARNGSIVDEIVSASGVTRHEALLLARLHNPSVREH
jgi:Tfp pilus assembly protein PilN